MHRRFEAFRSRAAERGIGVGRPLLDDSVASSREWLVNLCEAVDVEGLPRALVCGNDQTALSVIDVLRDTGVRVPRDVIVTGFDGILAASIGSPTLTTGRQPMGTMGRMAAKLLDERGWRALGRAVRSSTAGEGGVGAELRLRVTGQRPAW